MLQPSGWSTEEDNILRQHWRPGEWNDVLLSLLPGRKRLTIQRRAAKLCLTRPMQSSALPWQRHEDEILRKYYAQEGAAVADRLPGRSEKACKLQARRLGLSYESASALRDACGKYA